MSLLAFTLPVAAMGAQSGKPKSKAPSYVAPGLLAQAEQNPNQILHVIIQSADGAAEANAAFEDADKSDGNADGKLRKKLDFIDGAAVDIKAKKLVKLASKYGLTITPDSRIKLAGVTSSQLWTEASGVRSQWSKDAVTCAVDPLTGFKVDPLCIPFAGYTAPAAPTIAVVDSGIETRSDFGDRLLASVVITGLTPNSVGDGRGHGTLVAGLAAGEGAGYGGAAPNAKLVSLDVLDDNGVGRASDVIAAADWIVSNKAQYNIRVANFSLGVGNISSFRLDPLNKAIEKLWFSGVTVVTSAGNYGTGAVASNVKYAPANDPFVVTVGAADIAATASKLDDSVAPWSAWGRTSDGFSKPEIVAPGRYLAGPMPAASSIAAALPERSVAPGYQWMSGTSFSAAIVSGIAAQILAAHPNYTPDEVKGALMATAKKLPLVLDRSAGGGEVDAAAAVAKASPPNPNLALNGFVVADAAGGPPVFDGAAWRAAAVANPLWDATTWAQSTWAESSWAESTWAESTWAESTWAESTWAESTWAESTWAESTWAESTFVK